MREFHVYFIKGLILVLIISISGLSKIYGYERLITYGLMPFLLIISLYLNNFKSFALKNNIAISFLLIVIWSMLLTFFLDLDKGNAIKIVIKLIGVFVSILFTLELLQYSKYNFTEIFFISFIVSFYILSIYLFLGNNIVDSNLSSGEYIDRSQFDLNANTYSYFSFFAVISTFYLFEFKKKKLYFYLSGLTSFLSIYLSFVTASRSGILFAVSVPLFYWIFIFKSIKLGNILKPFLTLSILSLILIKLYDFYKSSYLNLRVEQSLELGDSRSQLADDAIRVFVDNLFTGVGPGQFYLYSFNRRSFSHNSYTEIAANMGVIGLILLLIIFVKPLYSSIQMYYTRAYKKYRNLLKLNVLFFFFFILYNNLYVFYLTIFGMIFFGIIISIQYKIKYGIQEL